MVESTKQITDSASVQPSPQSSPKLLDSKKNSIIEKISKAAKNIFSSPTFGASLLILGTIIFTPIAIHLAMPTASIFTTNILAIYILFLLIVFNKKIIIYETSLWYNIILNKLNPEKNPWYNEIKIPNSTKGKLILGAIPLKDEDFEKYLMSQLIIEAGGKDKLKDKLAVLSANHYEELTTPTIFSDPVTPKDWKDKKVTQKIIQANDFEVPTDQQIKDGVDFIEAQMNEGKNVYVHCKAGKGRSASIIACFLLKKINDELNDGSSPLLIKIKAALEEKKLLKHPDDIVLTVIDYIKMQRPNISLPQQKKIDGIKAFYERTYPMIAIK